MTIRKVTDHIDQLSVEVKDMLFEGLWEIPHGVTVNSYVVKGEKTALIDGVCGWDGVPEKFFALLDTLEVKLEDLDYLVINHMEPDHSGWMEQLREIKPDFTIVCTRASKMLLEAFYGHIDKIQVVNDKDTLDLGGGKTLEFITMPNVHWPDSMMTYVRDEEVLLACDVFGTFGTFEGKRFDEELEAEEMALLREEGARYFSNIIGAFTGFVKKAVPKLDAYTFKVIAPGHGMVFRKSPETIIGFYDAYIKASDQGNPEEVTLIYGSMYGMTEKAAMYVASVLRSRQIKVHTHKIPETSWGTIIQTAWTSGGIILAMPTYENKMFPPMAAVLEELAKKKVQNKVALRLGSYGWSGGASKELAKIAEEGELNWHFVPEVEFKGAAKEEDYVKLDASIEAFLATLKSEKQSLIQV